jgi:hypothetical protein
MVIGFLAGIGVGAFLGFIAFYIFLMLSIPRQ